MVGIKAGASCLTGVIVGTGTARTAVTVASRDSISAALGWASSMTSRRISNEIAGAQKGRGSEL